MKVVAIMLLVLGLVLGAAYFMPPFAARFRLFGSAFGFEVSPNVWGLVVAAALFLAASVIFYRARA